MENTSQKLYRIIVNAYADISGRSKFSLNGHSLVGSDYYKIRLAREIEKNYYVDCVKVACKLKTLNDFAEYVKKFNIDVRLPYITQKVEDIFHLFFRNIKCNHNEIIFDYAPGKFQNTLISMFCNQVEDQFHINYMQRFELEKLLQHCNITEIADWIFLNENSS